MGRRQADVHGLRGEGLTMTVELVEVLSSILKLTEEQQEELLQRLTSAE